MIGGTAYGVALNDRAHLAELAGALTQAPYGKPPVAPILYVKPRNCFAANRSVVTIPADVAEVAVGATIAIERAMTGASVARLAIDLFAPHASFYRPAIAERCRDGFLPLGPAVAMPSNLATIEIITYIGGVERHRWNLSRLVRDPVTLDRDVSSFMTLMPGDILLSGIAGDAPFARAGEIIEVAAEGFPALTVALIAEQQA
ncbi:fumarylacetoacetate hydrolase family protein [Sphingomonas sp. QA11]|uniref:fumarylacetoacetate hydrolase family protein n=1 Tax=Sphingomonas sp. QA11 TaxID=2950605 RepID=UPI00234B3C2C|nr:fumarylacetoacetate hydrolase family protein [Sphingomonas sp. QA11]WCM29480.1 fumarylacetoacetate hydrolase family protein [Sphingomonas sp. QA11]